MSDRKVFIGARLRTLRAESRLTQAELAARLVAEHHARAVRAIGSQLDPQYTMDRLAVALEVRGGERRFDLDPRC